MLHDNTYILSVFLQFLIKAVKVCTYSLLRIRGMNSIRNMLSKVHETETYWFQSSYRFSKRENSLSRDLGDLELQQSHLITLFRITLSAIKCTILRTRVEANRSITEHKEKNRYKPTCKYFLNTFNNRLFPNYLRPRINLRDNLGILD